MIDYDYLEKRLADMKPTSKLYKLVRNEIKRRGHWKGAPRGKAFQGGSHDPTEPSNDRTTNEQNEKGQN